MTTGVSVGEREENVMHFSINEAIVTFYKAVCRRRRKTTAVHIWLRKGNSKRIRKLRFNHDLR